MDEQTFLILAARRLSGEASAEDLKELKNFMEADESFKKKYELLQTYWEQKNNIQTDTSNALQKVLMQINNESDENRDLNRAGVEPSGRKVIKLFIRFSKVAVIALACIATAWFIFSRNEKDLVVQTALKPGSWQVKKTAKGTKSTIKLADGTKVILNADSKLEYPEKFTGAIREVHLTGEAFFDVKHDENTPFIIYTSKLSIKVLGTEFNVRSYPEDSISETTLIRGLIEVTLNSRPSDKIILRPKEKLIVSNESSINTKTAVPQPSKIPDTRLVISNLHYVSPSDSAIVETSWLDNKLVFQNKSFSDLAGDLERRYGVNIEIRNDLVKDFRFTGIFEKENIEQVLNALSLTEKFNYRKEKNSIIIY